MTNRKIGLLVIVASLLLISWNGYGQEKKLTKEETKEMRRRQRDLSYNYLDSLLRSGRFVLEAEFLQGRTGERMLVNSMINFLRVNFGKGTIQVGSNMGMGYNGVGGVTAEGEIRGWKMDKNDRNHTINIRFSIDSTLGHYDLLMNTSAGNYSSVTITGLRAGILTMTGRLVPLRNSRVFQGQTNY